MLYGIDACPINKSQINSLQFAVTGMLMKLFNTRSTDIVDECVSLFGFPTVSVFIYRRKHRFLFKYGEGNNTLCKSLADIAADELRTVALKLHSF